MATKKPKKRKGTKRKQAAKEEKSVISELSGFKLGEKIWYTTANGVIGFGKIDGFYPNDSQGPAVLVQDEINHGFRCGLLESASYAPPKGGKGRLRRAKNREAMDAVKKK